MGCGTSSKEAAYSPSLVPCVIQCQICTLPYDSSDRTPMVIPCGHTLCKECLSKLPKAACPIDRTPLVKKDVKPNFELLKQVELQTTVQFREVDPQNLPICGKGHILKWQGGAASPCSNCSKVLNLMECSKCQFRCCPRCLGYKPTMARCFNGHDCTWLASPKRCFQCGKNGSGWQCLKENCLYNYCSECSKISMVKHHCPNGHQNVAWTPDQVECCKCGAKYKGWNCKQDACDYALCKKCGPPETECRKCPNNHFMKWVPTCTLKCQLCNLCDCQGFECGDCKFYVCCACNKINLKSKYCPNEHGVLEYSSRVEKCYDLKHTGKCKDGFKCKACRFSICRNCLGVEPFTRWCLLQHEMTWKLYEANAKPECTNCGVLSESGWACDTCSVCFCSKCAKVRFQGSQQCPNSHPILWRNVRSNCFVCKRTDTAGAGCLEGCGLFICCGCQQIDMRSGRCPNRHELKFADHVIECVLCNGCRKGWECRPCNFSICLVCVKNKLNRVSCPNYHPQKQLKELAECERCAKYQDDCYACSEGCLLVCNTCLKK